MQHPARSPAKGTRRENHVPIRLSDDDTSRTLSPANTGNAGFGDYLGFIERPVREYDGSQGKGR